MWVEIKSVSVFLFSIEFFNFKLVTNALAYLPTFNSNEDDF